MSPLSLRAQHANRYRQLMMLLARYGRRDTLRPFASDDDPDADVVVLDGGDARERGEALVSELQELGPTFVKLGQMLSTRGDLLPREYVDALSTLQDGCEPFAFAEVERVVQGELGVRMSRLFAEFDDHPVAAASLGQVHRAVLRDGRVVAVKVQRPGIRARMADDLEVLGELAEFLDARSKNAKRYGLNAAFDEFRRALIAELDYRREATNLRTLGEITSTHPCIFVPQPFDDLTTGRVLTMEFVPGRQVKDLGPLARVEADLSAVADDLFGAYLEQILRAGFFHADPHPANLILTPERRLALIDVGMVGQLGVDVRKLLAKLMVAVMNGRADHVVRIARQLGTPEDDFDETRLRRSIDEMIPSVAQAAANRDLGSIMIDLARQSVDAGLRPAPELALLGKTMLNLQHVGAILDPTFEPMEALRRHMPDVMRSQADGTPGAALASLLEMKEFVEELPERVNRAIDTVASGHFELRLQAFDETQFLKGLHKLANVAAAGLILAALIVGSALLASRSGNDTLRTDVALAVFTAAACCGLAMLGWIGYSTRHVRVRRRN